MFYLTPEVLDGLIKEIDESFRQFKPFQVSELCHLSALKEALLILKTANVNAMQKARIDQYGYANLYANCCETIVYPNGFNPQGNWCKTLNKE